MHVRQSVRFMIKDICHRLHGVTERIKTLRMPMKQYGHLRLTSILLPKRSRTILKRSYRLYDLIWKRFFASQMENAIFDSTRVDIEGAKCVFVLPVLS